MAKRNIKALKRLRAVFAKVPPALVNMDTMLGIPTMCGTAGCLLYWANQDEACRALVGVKGCMMADPKVWGLGERTFSNLFAFRDIGDRTDRSRITKAKVMDSLNRVIEGKPIKPYVIKSA